MTKVDDAMQNVLRERRIDVQHKSPKAVHIYLNARRKAQCTVLYRNFALKNFGVCCQLEGKPKLQSRDEERTKVRK